MSQPSFESTAVREQSTFNRSDLYFRGLLEKLPAGAYTCDADGLITYFNEHAVQVWGRAPKLNDPIDRFCGSFKLFAADGSPLKHDQCWMALALKEEIGFNGEEIVVERPDGHRLTVLAHANPIHDESGELIGAVNVLVDISERKQAERALWESEQRLRVALDTGKLGSWELDVATGDLHASDTCKANFGLSPDTVLSHNSLIDMVHPDDQESMRDALEVALNDRTVFEGEYRVLWPDASTHWIIVSGRGIYCEGGKSCRMVGVTLDITERKRAEAERRRQELERALEQQMTEERQRIGRELHDGFRQQLVGINMLAADLQRKLEARNVPEAKLVGEFSKIIATANGQLRHLIGGLLPVTVGADALLPALERASKNIEQWFGVPCFVHDRVGQVSITDEAANHLFCIAREAMTNAAKHSKAPQIEIFLRSKSGTFVLEVRDTGDGLPDDFERRGSFGLTSMRRRAELIGAELDIRNLGVGGTSVICTLPL